METNHSGQLAHLALCVALAFTLTGCAVGSAEPVLPAAVSAERIETIRRAQVWTATDVESMNIKDGPQVKGAFKPDATVTCDYVDERLTGGTPKFECAIDEHDHVKVKYGQDNGEVYAEVAATRLLWALGFPADAEYPVTVICRGCPADPWKDHTPKSGETSFEFAAIERKYPGKELEPGGKTGWAWPELDLVDESAGGAPREQREALKLLAVFMQHTDTKPEQQRVLCAEGAGPKTEPKTDQKKDAPCQQPIMMINDLGVTFGRANLLNKGSRGSTNLDTWSEVPIWKDPARCVGKLSKSVTGTLENPTISEAGRKFLADRLSRLTDDQIADLFETARLSRRTVKRDGVVQGATTDAWVREFKNKRAQIVGHTCPV